MMSDFPLGFRFSPTEQELVGYYLRNKVTNQPLSFGCEGMFIERDLYGKNATPWILFNDNDPWHTPVDPLGKVLANQKLVYVFTKLSNVGKIGDKNKNRTAGCGQWHGNTTSLPVKNGSGEVIGNKKTFTFKSEEETVGQWTMYEYALADDGTVEGVNLDDYVLCRIKKDDSKISKGGRLVQGKKSRCETVESVAEESNHQGDYLVQGIPDASIAIVHGGQIDEFQGITIGVDDISSMMHDQTQISIHEYLASFEDFSNSINWDTIYPRSCGH